ncbi:outer membrane protein [Bartonella doshiae]|uniref:Opacity protein and related surface antigens n=2 Tax=Bartonella doshiae TaxID=33044 RepID=A0A380ZG46_BARDO|nr:outer membrane protein [Bartonella doshiae]EJF80997.1 hypothetical protein MCS_00710 [Bartonella doshiae NCTC 12862 = ATCC 700133]MBB6159294.1 opacity protein-like surface antigen [Bartonella doshiae]SUV45145.1 Opacity protein and related surface antigens [Bartonella doshiae]
MDTKRFITVFVFSLVSVSMTQAANVMLLKHSENVDFPLTFSPSIFSWEGFYFGGQIGGFSSEISTMTHNVDIPLYPNEDSKNKWFSLDKKYLPKLSGSIGSFYGGSNIHLGDGFIFGIEADIFFSERNNTKTSIIFDELNDSEFVENTHVEEEVVTGERVFYPVISNQEEIEENRLIVIHTLKQKWTGATRVRFSFPEGKIMPYISAGIVYGQFQDIFSTTVTGLEKFFAISDDTKTMIGYTLGSGIDFAVTDNVIMRVEYRYSNFGEKKFKDEIKIDYKTNDFRFGVAYKL